MTSTDRLIGGLRSGDGRRARFYERIARVPPHRRSHPPDKGRASGRRTGQSLPYVPAASGSSSNSPMPTGYGGCQRYHRPRCATTRFHLRQPGLGGGRDPIRSEPNAGRQRAGGGPAPDERRIRRLAVTSGPRRRNSRSCIDCRITNERVAEQWAVPAHGPRTVKRIQARRRGLRCPDGGERHEPRPDRRTRSSAFRPRVATGKSAAHRSISSSADRRRYQPTLKELVHIDLEFTWKPTAASAHDRGIPATFPRW